MKISEIPVPEVYKTSSDFRFFLNWFEACLTKIQHDTENFIDLYDPQRCPSHLLWLLGDTMGFKFDDRLPYAFNRLVLIYFMSMIHNKGSKTGVTLAAEVNLAQFNIASYGQENPILYDRLEDTSVPVNSVYVNSDTAAGYIDVVYFSSKEPVDACIEYVRPLGMYVFQHAGVKFDARTQISVDARLTNTRDVGVSIGSTHIGHYSRKDYASMQRMRNEQEHQINTEATRDSVWYRNVDIEGDPNGILDPGWRSLYSLQLCNNEHIMDSLLPDPENKERLFALGYKPQPGQVTPSYPADYLKPEYRNTTAFKQTDDYSKPYNLQYDKSAEEHLGEDVYTAEPRSTTTEPKPKVNPIMAALGDTILPDESADDN